MTFPYFLYYLYVGFCLQGTSQFTCGLFLALFSLPFPSLPSSAPLESPVCSLQVSPPPTLAMICAKQCPIEGDASQDF